MNNRNAAVVVVLVLGGSLMALRFTGERRAPAPSPAPAEPPPPTNARPAAPPPAEPAKPSRAQVPPRDPDRGEIDGIVINGVTRDGVPDAELTFIGDAGVATFRTGRDGRFALTPAGTGRFTLASITAPGFLPYSSHAAPVGFSAGQVTLARGEAVHGVTLLLYPAVDYEGIVVDAHGAPIPAARTCSDRDREDGETFIVELVAYEDRPTAAWKDELADGPWRELREPPLHVPIGARAELFESPESAERDPIGDVVASLDPAEVILDLKRVDRTHETQLFARSLITVA